MYNAFLFVFHRGTIESKHPSMNEISKIELIGLFHLFQGNKYFLMYFVLFKKIQLEWTIPLERTLKIFTDSITIKIVNRNDAYPDSDPRRYLSVGDVAGMNPEITIHKWNIHRECSDDNVRW